MNKIFPIQIPVKTLLSTLVVFSLLILPTFGQESDPVNTATNISTTTEVGSNLAQVQWLGGCNSSSSCNCNSGASCNSGAGCNSGASCGGNCGNGNGGKSLVGVDQFTKKGKKKESGWADAGSVPWEAFGYGEYVGPHRPPHVGEYRLRVDDQLEFVYLLTREKSLEPYQLYVGDVIQISSAIDSSLSQEDITILSDGTISLSLIGRVRVAGKTVSDLQRELNDKYTKYVKNPAIVVQVTESDTPLRDLIQSVDATAGQGGQVRQATVSPDGTVQLPLVGSVPAVGLTLAEAGREVNARYRLRIRGVQVTPVLIERAPRFIYVVGEVDQPGRFELLGPTTAIQAVALAGSFLQGGNLRQVVVFRRDQNYRLTATKLDLAGGLLGKEPHPSDEIWLRDSDIVLIPKKPIQRFSEAVNLYLTNTLYSIFPQQGVAFNFDNFTPL